MGLNMGGKCGMFFLVTINLIFFLLGVGLLIVGILLKVDTKVIDSDKVVATLNEVDLNGSLKFGNVAQSLPILLICVGVFILLIAGLGMFGACCKNRCMLVTYGIIVLLIFILQIVIVVLFAVMKNKIEDTVKEQLSISLKKYDGVNSTSEVSTGWDLMFIGFDCCGVDAVSASNAEEFSASAWVNGGATEKAPYSCCNGATEDNYKTTTNAACQNSPYTNINTKGCYDAVKDYLAKYQNAAIGVGAALLIVEIIGFVFAFVLCRAIGKDDFVV